MVRSLYLNVSNASTETRRVSETHVTDYHLPISQSVRLSEHIAYILCKLVTFHLLFLKIHISLVEII